MHSFGLGILQLKKMDNYFIFTHVEIKTCSVILKALMYVENISYSFICCDFT